MGLLSPLSSRGSYGLSWHILNPWAGLLFFCPSSFSSSHKVTFAFKNTVLKLLCISSLSRSAFLVRLVGFWLGLLASWGGSAVLGSTHLPVSVCLPALDTDAWVVGQALSICDTISSSDISYWTLSCSSGLLPQCPLLRRLKDAYLSSGLSLGVISSRNPYLTYPAPDSPQD